MNTNQNPNDCLASAQKAAGMICTQGEISRQLITIARTAHALCDNTEEDHTGPEVVIRFPSTEYSELESALNLLDELPDPLGEAATGPRKAEYWLAMAGPDTTQKPKPLPYDQNQPGIFKQSPLPWRYDSRTRNVIAADGSIVCRNGDDIYGVPEVGEAIVKVFNSIKL